MHGSWPTVQWLAAETWLTMPLQGQRRGDNAMVSMAAPRKDVLSFGPFRLTAAERLLTRDGAPVELGARAFDILIALVSTPNEAISKKELLLRVWPRSEEHTSELQSHSE